MRAVGCLVVVCLLAGFISAEQYAFQVGKSYRYRAHGRLLAGITEINTQYAGLEITYNVELTPIAANRLILKPTDVKVKEVNDEQDGGWRDVPELKGATEVELPGAIRQYIESPVEIKFNKGVIESIKVQGDLPNYALNIKKAQVSHFVLDSAGHNAVVTGNMNRGQPNHVRPQDPTTQSGTFYESMEETVLGDCETYYTLSESGPYSNPRSDPLKAELNEDDNEDSQERQGRQSGERRQIPPGQDSSSSDESQEERKHVKYMKYREMIKRSESSEESGALAAEVFHNFCEDKHKLMEFTKTVNYSMCHKKPVLGYASPSLIVNSRAGDNSFGSAIARVIYSRYIACGQDRKQYTILKIVQEEHVYQGLLRKEKTLGGSVKNLTLISILPTNRTPVGPSNPKEITDITYTFSVREQKMRRDGQLQTAFEAQNANENQSQSESGESNETPDVNYRRQRRDTQYSAESAEERQMDQEQQKYGAQWATSGAEGHGFLPKPSLTQPPLNPMLASPLSRVGMKQRVEELLKEIVRDIIDQKPLAEHETVSKIATISKILRYLPYNDVEILYNQLAIKDQTDEDKIRRKVFFDCVAMAGTNPNVKLIIDLIQRKLIGGEEANQLVMTFPMFIRTPTVDLIHYFFTRLVEFSPSPDNMDQLHTTAYLAFTNLIHDACVNTRIAYTRYPVQIYGEFCSETVATQYVPHIVKQLKWALEQINHNEHSVAASHWATVFLAALGNTGHPSIVEHIQYVLDNVSDPYIKTKAVFAFKRLVTSRSVQNVPIQEPMAVDRKNRDILTDEVIEKKVLPVLISVAFDRTEAKEVRMAAVALVVRATPAETNVWQHLAYSTWFEHDQEVHSYIYHTIFSLSHLKRPADPVTFKAHQLARAVLPLVKPIKIGLARSRSFYESDFYDEIQSGFMHTFSQFGSVNSVLPNAFYYQNFKYYGSDAMTESPVEFSAHGHTLNHIINHLLGKFVRPTQSIVEGNEAIKVISDLLHIVDREQDETPQASIQFKLRAEMERIVSINRETIDILIELLKKELVPSLLTGMPINYQKSFQLTETNYEFPNIFGIPTQVKTHTHHLVSIRGSIRFLGFKDLQVNVDLHPIFSYKTHGLISFKSPFTGKAYQAGVQHHAVVEFPFRATFRKTAVGTLEFAVTPTHIHEGEIGGQIDIFTFHRRPYTAIITDECWPTSHKEGGQVKIVHAIETPFKDQKEFGKSLGFAFELVQETEFQPDQEKFPGWSRYLERFQGTYGGLLHKGLMGAKTLRLAERRLILDNVKSSTKTLYLVVAGDYRRHHKHVVAEVSSEEQRQSGDSNQVDSTENDENVRQVYDSRAGDFDSYMNKNLKQRQYSEYKQYKVQRQQQESQQYDSSEESYEDKEGQLYNQDPQNYRASFEEDEQETNQDPAIRHRRWIVIALLGKTSPLHAPLKIRGQQTHHESAPSTVQYLFYADVYPGHVQVRASAGESTKVQAAELPMNSAAVDRIRKTLQAPLTRGQTPFCGDYEGSYEFPRYANRDSLLTLRENLLRQDLTVKINGAASVGQSCHNKLYNVTFNGKLSRDNEMKEYAQSGSYEAKQCTEDEKKGFASSPVCIVNSEQQAAALNIAEIEFKATPLPVNVVNATLQVRQFFKAFYYRYMTFDPVPTPIRQPSPHFPERYLKIQARLTPEKEYLTLRFFQPTENLFFEDIKLNSFGKAIFPVTATQTLKQNVRDRVWKTESSCSVEGRFVNTMDNVTYEFDPEAATNCKHVLVQDCSGQKAVSVLADNLASSKVITTVLLPGNFRIELLPMLRQSETQENDRAYVTATTNNIVIPGQGRVLVNGHPVKELPTTVYDKNGHFIATIEEAAGAALQLFADDVKVTTDGRHVVVYPSNELRNSSCGLCGNFDVSKTIDFRSPRDCPLSSGTYLMAAYAFQQPWKTSQTNNQVCKIAEDVKKAIEQEDRDCHADEFIRTSSRSGSCQEGLVNKIGDVVFTLVRNALRPIPGVNGKKLAEKARNKVKDILKGNIKSEEIADLVATGCTDILPAVGRFVKPAIKWSAKKTVDQLCKHTGCCNTVWYF